MSGEQVRKEEDVVLWPYLETATDEEAPNVDAAILLPLLYEQTADEESTEDEEDVHASPAEVVKAKPEEWRQEDRPRRVEVHDHENGDTANEIELDFAVYRLR